MPTFKKHLFWKTFDSFFLCFVYDLIFLFFFVFAAFYGYRDIVHILLDNNANIDHQNKYGDTALILAGKKFNLIFQFNLTIPIFKIQK